MNRRTRAKRKLIAHKLYIKMRKDFLSGVPMTVLVRNYKLDITPTALSKILTVAIPDDTDNMLYKSFFPRWLDPNDKQVQINPLGWVYVGRFPLGEWQVECP